MNKRNYVFVLCLHFKSHFGSPDTVKQAMQDKKWITETFILPCFPLYSMGKSVWEDITFAQELLQHKMTNKQRITQGSQEGVCLML